MAIVPITYWTKTADLARMSGQPDMMRDRVFIGLPFIMDSKNKLQSESYIVLPLNKFFNPHVKKEAARINGIITRTVIGNADRNLGWQQLMRNEEIADLAQNPFKRFAWSYILLETVLREQPEAYLNGKQHIADFFAERFQLEFGKDLRPPFIREQFHHHLLDRANLDASLDLKMELAFRQQQILDHLEGVQLLSQTYMEVMMVLMALLSGVTGILVLDIILEAFIGYMMFLADLAKAEQDGLITEDEAFGSWFSLAGIFFPFARILPGFARTLVETGLGIVAIAAIILQITIALLRAAVGLLEAVASDGAGFDDYAQYDPATTIFIPA